MAAHKRSRRDWSRRGETQDRNLERTWEGEEPELVPKLREREMPEEAQISTQRDGQDPGTTIEAWNTSAGEDSGHGRARRVNVRTVKASGLWRDEERQASQVPREPQRPSKEESAPSAQKSRSPGGRRRRDGLPGDAGQHIGGEQSGRRSVKRALQSCTM